MGCIHQHLTGKAVDQLMVLWAISAGGTGGKVCRSTQRAQLALGSVQRSPGRLTDERSEGCNSSCSPPRLATRRHAEMKCQLISSLVSCCDSSFVNVWTRLFKHRHLASLWLLSFSQRAFSFYRLHRFPRATLQSTSCAPSPFLPPTFPDTLLVTFTLFSCYATNLTCRKN